MKTPMKSNKSTQPKRKFTKAEAEENYRRYLAMSPKERDAAFARSLRGETYLDHSKPTSPPKK